MNVKRIKLSILDNTTEFGEIMKLNIGQHNIAKRYFKQSLPTPYEIEMAIIEIEDAIESIKPHWDSLTKNSQIEVTATQKQFADILSFAHLDKRLTSDQLEFAFNRLADIVSGSPKRLNEFPDSAEFVSTMLILIEVMHHLSITEIHLLDE